MRVASSRANQPNRNGVRRLLLLLLSFALLLAPVACGRDSSMIERRLLLFGTLVDIVIRAPERVRAEAAIDEIEQSLEQQHAVWHAWRDSPLTELNRAIARGEQTRPDPSLIPILEQAMRLSRQSDGLFNPAIGALVAAWGFHRDEPPEGPPPTRAELIPLLSAAPRMSDLQLIDGQISSRNRAVQLDLGAFAKGVAVDRAVEILRYHGIEHAIVNAGGDLRALGDRGDRPWRIGVRHPDGEGVMATIETQGDEAIFTSGTYERYREYNGVRYPHILDPRSGQPIREVVSVTVIHREAAVADAAATALAIADADSWLRIAAQMGIQQVMRVTRDRQILLTPLMAERVELREIEQWEKIEILHAEG